MFNHPVYGNPSTCIDCSGSGIISSLEANSQMRQMQLGFRVTFSRGPSTKNQTWGSRRLPQIF